MCRVGIGLAPEGAEHLVEGADLISKPTSGNNVCTVADGDKQVSGIVPFQQKSPLEKRASKVQIATVRLPRLSASSAGAL
jgi:hypothetical protein